MNESVSDLIAARARYQATLASPLVWSVAAHACVVAAIFLAPARSTDQPQRIVMSISLGGAPGPRAGGMTQMGGRAVPPPPPEPVKQAPPTPPAPARPAATLPSPKPAAAPPRQTRQPAPPTPAATEPPREGSTRVETGARGQGFGLSTGGNGARGMELEVTNFCCPEYLEVLRAAIERAWDRNQGIGVTTMRFRILRDGTIDMVSIYTSSGNQPHDAAAARAIASVQRVPALPAAFPEQSLTLRMRFEN